MLYLINKSQKECEGGEAKQKYIKEFIKIWEGPKYFAHDSVNKHIKVDHVDIWDLVVKATDSYAKENYNDFGH